jgi:hypothetical protein
VAQGAVAAKQTEQAFATSPLRTGKRPPFRRHCASDAPLPRQVDSAERVDFIGSMPNRSGASWLVQEAQPWSAVRIPRPDLEVSRAAKSEGANALLASLGHLVFHAAGMQVPLASRSSKMRH